MKEKIDITYIFKVSFEIRGLFYHTKWIQKKNQFSITSIFFFKFIYLSGPGTHDCEIKSYCSSD